MLESIDSSKFVSHKVRMSGEFDSRKDSYSTELEQRPQIFVKLSFRELRGSKLSGLQPFDMAIIHWFKNRLKTERKAVSSWENNLCKYFFDLCWKLICHNKWYPGTSEILTLPEIAVGTLSCVAWHENYPGIFTCWRRSLLVATSKFGLHTIRWHSATRKHPFFYPHGDRSGLRKPKKDKHWH